MIIMKRNLTFTYLMGIALCFISFTTLQAQECLPTAALTVSGVADANASLTYSFTDVPVGTVIELVTSAADNVFNIELCGTNADGWADGDHDSSCHIISSNDGAATYIQNIEDGCTNGAGPDFWGPDNGSFGVTAMGTTYLYITEWNAAGDANCEVSSGQTYDVNITIAGPGPCEAGVYEGANPLNVCPSFPGTLNPTGATADGGFVVSFNNVNTGGTGATGGGFSITGVNALPFNLDAGLNGILAANNFPDLDGAWEVTLYALDAAEAACDSADVFVTNFISDDTDPICILLDIDELSAVTSWSITPNPSNGPVRVALELNATYNEVSVEIFDVTGKIVASRISNNVNAINHEFDFTSLANGLYLAKIGVDGNYTTEKIMISK